MGYNERMDEFGPNMRRFMEARAADPNFKGDPVEVEYWCRTAMACLRAWPEPERWADASDEEVAAELLHRLSLKRAVAR